MSCQGSVHQTFQVPKMEVLDLYKAILAVVFFYIRRIHTAYILTYPKPNFLTCGQYIKMVPQKSLTFYFQGVWRGEYS